MKTNRSRSSILTSMWSTLVGAFESRTFRRALGTLLIVANIVSSTGMVLAKESYDESSSDTSSYIVEESAETETNAISESESSETSAPAEVTDSSEEKGTSSQETSDPSEDTDTSSKDTEDGASASEMSSNESSEETSVSSSDSSSSETSEESSKNTETETDTSSMESSSDTSATSVESSDSSADSSTTSSENSEQSSDSTEVASAPETSDTTILSYRGKDFSVIVEFGPETNIPSGAELQVREITSQPECDSYYGQLTDVMSSEEIFSVRFFDISLVMNGIECEPKSGTTVGVKIVLDDPTDEEVSVVHLPDYQEANVVETEFRTTSAGTEVTFEADGFSAYAIVQGPTGSGDEEGWVAVNNMSDVQAHVADGIYIRFSAKAAGPYRYLSNKTTYIKDVGGKRRYGITKTRNPYTKTSDAISDLLYPAVPYYFENLTLSANGNSGTCNLYCYDTDGSTKLYVKEKYIDNSNGSFELGSDGEPATFTITCTGVNTFTIKGSSHFFNEQGCGNGTDWGSGDGQDGEKKSISGWNTATPLNFFSYSINGDDPYGLNGKTYGLLNTKGGTGGRTLQATSSVSGNLDSNQISVVAREGSHNQDKLYVTAEDGATMWTFHWHVGDYYYITAEVDGSVKYLTIDNSGLSMSDTPCDIRVVPGTETASGQISLRKGNNRLTFSGDAATGFNINNSNDHWLYLVEERDLTPDYKKTYSAKKISVSDPQLTDGSQVIVYTRRWEEITPGTYAYRYYAIDHDGSLVLCYESGDYLQWTDDMINTLLWDFNIHYWEGTNEENDYYDLYNEYSQKYIAPKITSNQVLSDEPIGIQLDGRKNGRYYSTIVAWDDPSYSYASLTTEPGSIKQGSFAEAEDFYFAIIQDNSVVDIDLSPIETVDNNLYGIEMKMQDFNSKKDLCLFLENKDNVTDAHHMGILSTELGDDGYPTVMYGEKQSLGNLFNKQTTVNHLFINSTHEATGYFEYDSTQNFASLNKETHDFTVYQELGTTDETEKTTLKHGQFLPFNDLEKNLYAKKNTNNLYNMHARLDNSSAGLLPDSDPRKYERLYLVKEPNLQFGMEMKASFIQTPSGLDDWGHDIIYEFTGDDDFWLYVDGELVIDLGGCHSAMAGSINFATGKVVVNGVESDLKTIFYNNYLGRDGHTAAEAQAYVDGLFVPGTSVFRDYTSHEMKMFYFERGGGASNLHMKFNQSSVTPGNVVLSKTVTGVDETDSVMAEFPYQIFYEKKDDQGVVREYPLTNNVGNISVVYRGTNDPVAFAPSREIDGVTYSNVFFLKPGEECEIAFPDRTINYRVVECGVNPYIYSHVFVNGAEIQPTESAGYPNGRHDYGIEKVSAQDRTNVKYVNEIDPDALRVLNIQKKLYEEDGTTEIENSDARFNFRLYLSGEYDAAIPTDENKSKYVAYMYNYHVKDRDGNYCRWDTASGDFESIIGKTNLSQFNSAEKKEITFQTSMYGAISKIPAGYTVEVRGLMVGSHYMVEERDNEIPDGYSRREYDYYANASNGTKTDDSITPISQTMGSNNPKVVVNNLKGFGLRVYKEWTDKDFMDSHANVFFAVYKKVGNTYELADTPNHDVVHCMKTTSDTSYWYYEHLDPGLTLSNYEIREVKLTGEYTIAPNGVVTGYSSITPVENNGQIELSGRMTGADSDASYEYTVTYNKGSLIDGSNIRVDQVINDRPGLGLTKTAWDGTTLLPNAEFTVTSKDGKFKKRFVSDANGKITKAFFVEGMEYSLSEIKTPIGYYCPTEAITVIYRNGEFEVTDTSGGGFGTTKVKSGDDTLLGIKNKTYTLRVYKVDSMDDSPVEGAHFALHKQIKVGAITMFDYDPVPGFDDIVSGSDGLIPELNEQLAPGVYELRELSAPLGYLNLTHNVRFRVGDTGGITLIDAYSDVDVTSEDSADGSAKNFVMKIKNTAEGMQLTVSKNVTGNFGNRSEKFDFKVTFADSNNVPFNGGTVKTRTPAGTVELIQLDNTGSMTFQLAHGESIRFALPDNTKYTIEETSSDYKTTWQKNMEAAQDGRIAAGTLDASCTITYTNDKSGILPTGLDFTIKAILGAGLMLMMGAGAFAVAGKRRRDEDDPEDDGTGVKGIRRV